MNESTKPGRPPSPSTARVREIMKQRGCSYGTAYGQWRRELTGSIGQLGRPLDARVLELQNRHGCTYEEAHVLQRAENIIVRCAAKKAATVVPIEPISEAQRAADEALRELRELRDRLSPSDPEVWAASRRYAQLKKAAS